MQKLQSFGVYKYQNALLRNEYRTFPPDKYPQYIPNNQSVGLTLSEEHIDMIQ
jgi:hypothetical protein